MGEKFAVIDTETNWYNEVMSIGVVIVEEGVFEPIGEKYIIVEENAKAGGMFSYALLVKGQKPEKCIKTKAVEKLIDYLKINDVNYIFAYNAAFDYRCLPELSEFRWHDILKIAAYKQYNPAIPINAECYGTGRLKSGYKVGDIMLMFGEKSYCELHNALTDAFDELKIMKYLNYSIHKYPKLERENG